MSFISRYGTCIPCGCAAHECECSERHESFMLKSVAGPQTDRLSDDLVDEEELDVT